jgi:hypothetical protein
MGRIPPEGKTGGDRGTSKKNFEILERGPRK